MVRNVLGLKDALTLCNVLGGAAAIVFCIEQRLEWASYAIIVAYAFDALDGAVARLTGGGNRFGAELDNLADYLTFGIAPSFIVYQIYRPWALWAGILLACAIIVAATIRHVRNLVFDAPTTLCWIGLPRPAAGMIVVSLVHANLFRLAGLWAGVPLLLGVAWALLATFPTLNHRGRRLQAWVRFLIGFWVVSWIFVLLVLPRWFWDIVLVWVLIYACFSWTALEPQELVEYRQSLAAWKLRMKRA